MKTERELLVFILGYLNGLKKKKKIPNEDLKKIKDFIEGFRNPPRIEVEHIDEYEEGLDTDFDFKDSDEFSSYEEFAKYNNIDIPTTEVTEEEAKSILDFLEKHSDLNNSNKLDDSENSEK
ncbi:hypothetical protein [Mangrovimonas futianensis]|uniref:hypothetical protein n=1 Tax=Mangrovimonas futianensis TaxID=2895523 RepID=UPI001E569386|nr:hypothetical protein [Mangrovimonas futianensis]MCF1421035.1 hypothetical protein [Mangrovimonas futianensis]